MAQMTIATIEVRLRTFAENARIVQGAVVRAKDNTLISTMNYATMKRSIDCEVSFFDATEEATFRTNTLPGVPVAIDGDIVVTPFIGYVTIGQVTYRKWSADGSVLRRWTAIHIEEA
jgi:uncharacterized Zn-binding protein involved in type VI secretion